MKHIVWISSYPKSGNTWVRLILAGLFFTEDGLIDEFGVLKFFPKFDRIEFYKYLEKLSKPEYKILKENKKFDKRLMSIIYKYSIETQMRLYEKNKIKFFKTHCARVKLDEYYYTNSKTTLGFIYIIRDPRDIVISYAKFLNQKYEDVIDYLVKGETRGENIINGLIPEINLSWKNNYLSWKNFNDVPSLFIKYEDLINNFHEEVQKIVFFLKNKLHLEISNVDNKINNLSKTTSIEFLKGLESKKGFFEHSSKSKFKFFRSGKINQWKDELKPTELNKINEETEEILNQLNYL